MPPESLLSLSQVALAICKAGTGQQVWPRRHPHIGPTSREKVLTVYRVQISPQVLIVINVAHFIA